MPLPTTYSPERTFPDLFVHCRVPRRLLPPLEVLTQPTSPTHFQNLHFIRSREKVSDCHVGLCLLCFLVCLTCVFCACVFLMFVPGVVVFFVCLLCFVLPRHELYMALYGFLVLWSTWWKQQLDHFVPDMSMKTGNVFFAKKYTEKLLRSHNILPSLRSPKRAPCLQNARACPTFCLISRLFDSSHLCLTLRTQTQQNTTFPPPQNNGEERRTCLQLKLA